MMFRDILTILPILSILLFVIPKRAKAMYSTAVIAIGAIFAAVNALDILLCGTTEIMDQLSAFFILIISVVGLSTAIYSIDYLKHVINKKRSLEFSIHLISFVVLFYSMLLITLADNMLDFLILWELMTIASFLLIIFDAERRMVSRTALEYLILMHVGYIFLIAGFTVTSANGLDGGFTQLATYLAANEHNTIPLFILFLIGFGMKAGIFPLHFWLPETHSSAPSHVSAIMSGAVTSMGIYGVMRVISFTDSNLAEIGYIIMGVGVVTALWGVIQCAVQSNIKRLLGYSTIENGGIIFIALGMGILGKSFDNQMLAFCGLGAALLHTFNHSCFKSMLFMSAGSILASTGHVNMDQLGGLSRRMPVTTILFLAGSLAIVGLPPLNGFVSEYMIYNGLFNTIASNGNLVIISLVGIVVLSLVGGIALIAFSKAFSISFLGTPRCISASGAKESGNYALIAQALPLVMILIVGLAPFLFVNPLIDITQSIFSVPYESSNTIAILNVNYLKYSLLMLIFLASVCVLYYLRVKVSKSRTTSESVTWGCGYAPTKPTMQYTGESFSETFSRMSGSVTTNHNKKFNLDKLDIFPAAKTFSTKRDDMIGRAVSSQWLKFFHHVSSKMALFQSGKVNHYILNALLFIVLIFLLSILGVI